MRPDPSVVGHALDAVDAGFEFEPLEHVAAGDRDDRLLEAADAGLRQVHHLKAPAVQRRIALIHAEEIGGEKRRLLAAGAGAQFEDGIALVSRVLGQQHKPHAALELGNALVELGKLAGRQRPHLRIALGRQRGEILALRPRAFQSFDGGDERREVAVFLRELGEVSPQPRRIFQRVRKLRMAPHDPVELAFPSAVVAHASFSLPAPIRLKPLPVVASEAKQSPAVGRLLRSDAPRNDNITGRA